DLTVTGVQTCALPISLIGDFNRNYQEYEAKRKKKRQRKLGGGRGSYIETIQEKLFYILMYMKTYPTFDVASFYVGFARGNACTRSEERRVGKECRSRR